MNIDRIVFTGRDHVATDTIPEDLTPGPNQVLVKTTVTMVSQGTEMAALRQTHTRSLIPDPPAWLRYPSVPGYLQAGVIEAVGKGVTGFTVGERVLAEGQGCWNSHVSHLRVAADPRWLVKIPAAVKDEHAVMGKLASVALHGLRTVQPVIGESCAIIGLGVVGQLAARLALIAGMGPVVASDPVVSRRAVASRVPFLKVVTPAEVAAGDPEGYEHIIELSGTPQGFLTACQIARRLGRITVASCPHIPVELRLYEHVMSKSLQVLGAHGSSMAADHTPGDRWSERRQKELFLRLVAEGRLDVAPLITSTTSWREAPRLYQALIDKPADHLAVLFTWN